MKKINKILPRILIVILIATLISSIILTSVYAKYVTEKSQNDNQARPAVFELIMNSDDPKMSINFADDGEPANPVGYSTSKKSYGFSVRTFNSEVAAEYELSISFPKKVYEKIEQARKDRYAYGLWCDYKVYEADASGNLVDVTANGTESGNDPMVWKYTKTLDPKKNPSGTIEGETAYRLEFTFYNSTDASGANVEDYVYVTDLEISVRSKQID